MVVFWNYTTRAVDQQLFRPYLLTNLLTNFSGFRDSETERSAPILLSHRLDGK
jgi:hypothetical protein